jgi:hypothetical protein
MEQNVRGGGGILYLCENDEGSGEDKRSLRSRSCRNVPLLRLLFRRLDVIMARVRGTA